MIRPPTHRRQFDNLTRTVLVATVIVFAVSLIWVGPIVAIARILGALRP